MEPDVERSIANRSQPPLDVDKKDYERNGSSPSLSAPSITEDHEGQPGEAKDVELAQARSTTESVNPPPVKVPRAQRRGLFGRFSILAEVEEPKHYARRAKWFITFIIALAAIAAPLGSAIILRERHPLNSFAAMSLQPCKKSRHFSLRANTIS